MGDCKFENSMRRFNTIPKVSKSSRHQTWNSQVGSRYCANNQSRRSFQPVIPNLLVLNIHQYVHLGIVGRFRSLLNQIYWNYTVEGNINSPVSRMLLNLWMLKCNDSSIVLYIYPIHFGFKQHNNKEQKVCEKDSLYCKYLD